MSTNALSKHSANEREKMKSERDGWRRKKRNRSVYNTHNHLYTHSVSNEIEECELVCTISFFFFSLSLSISSSLLNVLLRYSFCCLLFFPLFLFSLFFVLSFHFIFISIYLFQLPERVRETTNQQDTHTHTHSTTATQSVAVWNFIKYIFLFSSCVRIYFFLSYFCCYCAAPFPSFSILLLLPLWTAAVECN